MHRSDRAAIPISNVRRTFSQVLSNVSWGAEVKRTPIFKPRKIAYSTHHRVRASRTCYASPRGGHYLPIGRHPKSWTASTPLKIAFTDFLLACSEQTCTDNLSLCKLGKYTARSNVLKVSTGLLHSVRRRRCQQGFYTELRDLPILGVE